jgi:hypothetical protein
VVYGVGTARCAFAHPTTAPRSDRDVSALHGRSDLTKIGIAAKVFWEWLAHSSDANQKAHRENVFACVIASASEAIQGRL